MMITLKTAAIVFSVIMSGAVLWPVTENFKEKPKDNFPLSYYPMFSAKRSPTQKLSYFIGYDSQHNRYTIPYRFIGSGGGNQVRKQLNKKVRNEKYDKIAMKVAKRLKRSQESPFNQLITVQLIRGTYDLNTYFRTGNKAPVSEKILSVQKIERQ